jgi:Fic-DOC domain mobile mystery protein B
MGRTLMNDGTTNGAKPLESRIIKDLIPSHISSQAELDRWEQDNISEALAWIEKRPPKKILSESFLRQFHKKMFCHTWRWAGKIRQTDVTLGAPFSRISVQLNLLCDDVQSWIENQTFEPDEIAARFHHRLVYIRAFCDGNGRHSRLVTDLLLERVLDRPLFTWGQARLAQTGQDRIMYIESLLSANQSGYQSLLEFVRS